MVPWRYSDRGITVSLRVTPRGGRDTVDGIETLSDGRAVVKVRVRAVAEGGEANRAVVRLLAQSLAVPQRAVRIVAGVTSRAKQVEIAGEPNALGRKLAAQCDGVDQRKDRAT